MYSIQRIIFHKYLKSDNWEENSIRTDLEVFYLSDEEMQFLLDLPREYAYHEYDNEFYVDRHPEIIREGIDNEEFIEDYENHLTEKFFVMYKYKKMEEDDV